MKKITQLGKLYETRIFLGVIIFVIILFISLILCNNLKSLYSGKSDFNSNSQNSFLEEERLFVTFIDAGKADAIVLHTNNSTVLIDTGLKSGGKELVQLIKSQGIDTIDYLILTHFDKDHVGGAARVIKKLKVNNIITSDYFKDSDEVEDYLEACDESGITPQILEDEISFTLDNVTYKVYPHIASTYSEKESNNSSLIISVEHGENRMLFTGDANNLRIEEFVTKQESNFKYQLLKVPYHGHYMECLPEFVNLIQPEYAVITSSQEEKEDKETVELLKGIGTNVLLTREGTIVVKSDGKNLTIEQ